MKHDRYMLKIKLSDRQKVCPACGKPLNGQGDGHEVFFRRRFLDDEYNVILVHHECHVPEAPHLNYNAALMKLCDYGPEAIEAWARELPLKNNTLPAWYWETKETWERALENDQDNVGHRAGRMRPLRDEPEG